MTNLKKHQVASKEDLITGKNYSKSIDDDLKKSEFNRPNEWYVGKGTDELAYRYKNALDMFKTNY